MSESLFLPRELFDPTASAKMAAPSAPPSEAVLDDLQRFSAPGPMFGSGRNRRLKPRDPRAPKVDLWLDLAS
jgi:hypothetical protein